MNKVKVREYYKNEGRIIFNKLETVIQPKIYGNLLVIDISYIRADLFDIEQDDITINPEERIKTKSDNIGTFFYHNGEKYDIHLKISLHNIKFNEDIISSFIALIEINLAKKLNLNNIVVLTPNIKKLLFATTAKNAYFVNVVQVRCNGIPFKNSVFNLQKILSDPSHTLINDCTFYSIGWNNERLHNTYNFKKYDNQYVDMIYRYFSYFVNIIYEKIELFICYLLHLLFY